MLPTSLPTLFAYAPCSLLSLVLRLILKNTSSPADVTTCVCARAVRRYAKGRASCRPRRWRCSEGRKRHDQWTLMGLGGGKSSARANAP